MHCNVHYAVNSQLRIICSIARMFRTSITRMFRTSVTRMFRTSVTSMFRTSITRLFRTSITRLFRTSVTRMFRTSVTRMFRTSVTRMFRTLLSWAVHLRNLLHQYPKCQNRFKLILLKLNLVNVNGSNIKHHNTSVKLNLIHNQPLQAN